MMSGLSSMATSRQLRSPVTPSECLAKASASLRAGRQYTTSFFCRPQNLAPDMGHFLVNGGGLVLPRAGPSAKLRLFRLVDPFP